MGHNLINIPAQEKLKTLWDKDINLIQHERKKSVKSPDIYGTRSIFHSPWVSDLSSFGLFI